MALKNLNLIRGKWSRYIVYILAAAFIAPAIWKHIGGSLPNNGFDLTGSIVPVTEIHKGGPPRDGIPALDYPKFVSAEKVTFLENQSRVLGVFRNGVAKAYPVKVLNWHEIVNDYIGGEPVVITFCPLCNSGMAFSSKISDTIKTFGVSGLIYNSDLLMYDGQTGSLWSQIRGQAISGSMKGTQLEMLPIQNTTWQKWKQDYPDSLVLFNKTGYVRGYARDPYEGYDKSDDLNFPVMNLDKRYHPKELVIGLKLDGFVKAYPFTELSRNNQPLNEIINNKNYTLEFDSTNRTGRVWDSNGDEVPTVIVYWFAWTAFYPDTEVFSAPESPGSDNQ